MKNSVTYSFVDNFIDQLGGYIEENYIRKGKDLSRLAVVFGGKRPVLFLKRELARNMGAAFYPPRFFAIDEFVSYLLLKKDLYRSTPDLDTCYLLYQLARQHTPAILKGKETFAQFLPWTKEILAFIDQLDLEKIEDKTLENIKANAEIGYPVPEDINRLLEHIVVLRRAYHKKLKEEKMLSRGLQYLSAAEAVAETSFDEFDEILFCNFFYFNRSEEAIVKNLYERGKAVLLFQGDERKWPVLTRIAKHFETPILEGPEPKTPRFDLKLHAGFNVHSQVGLVREILQDIKDHSFADLNRTVVVVPNPDHIIPLLSEVTQVVQDFNISLGYPLKRSSLHTLFEFIFQAQLSRKEHRYYTKDYLKVLSHPFIKNVQLSSDPAVTRILVHKIEEILTGKEATRISGSLFLGLEDIESLDELYMLTQEMCDRLKISVDRAALLAIVKEIHELCFEGWEKVSTFKGFGIQLESVLDVLTHKSFLKNYPLNLNIATKIYEIKDEFLHAQFAAEHFPQEDLFRIFESKVSGEIVAFQGSPLKGLQILGLFETRSLNFDNVIVMDVNEGVLPRLQIYEPLIPREVMISLNLDRLELEEEIQRYQFMRLISSAKKVHLVYQESKEKERSRFVEELIWEVQKHKKHVEAVAVTHASFEVKVAPQRRSVKKTPAMVEALKKHSFSASSLSMYLKNPMDFYYNYVLGLREQEDLLDEPEARQVGTFIHALIEHQFRPFLGKKVEITPGFREHAMRDFERRFDETFGRSMKSDSFLLKTVLADRLNRFWDNEQNNKDRQVEKLLYLEQTFEETIKLSCGEIRFKYIVDRVDQLADGTVLIVDYKTGAIDQMPKSLEQVALITLSRENIRDTIKSFQLPLYFHYLDKQFPGQPVNAALYNLRTLDIKPFMPSGAQAARQEINEVFLKALDFVVSEILDPAVDFVEDQ